MAQLMTDEQRLAALAEYNPKEHLISVGTNRDRTPVLYYPAAWRLYELRLRHPHFVLEAEIIHMNEEQGTVIVKAIGYDGLDYASSRLKGTALKQGRLAELDKVETKAKSRVARDIGIGTEYALDMDEDETDARHSQHTPVQSSQPRQTANGNGTANGRPAAKSTTGEAVKESARKQDDPPVPSQLKAMSDRIVGPGKFEAVKKSLLSQEIADSDLSPHQCAIIHGALLQKEKMLARASTGN